MRKISGLHSDVLCTHKQNVCHHCFPIHSSLVPTQQIWRNQFQFQGVVFWITNRLLTNCKVLVTFVCELSFQAHRPKQNLFSLPWCAFSPKHLFLAWWILRPLNDVTFFYPWGHTCRFFHCLSKLAPPAQSQSHYEVKANVMSHLLGQLLQTFRVWPTSPQVAHTLLLCSLRTAFAWPTEPSNWHAVQWRIQA